MDKRLRYEFIRQALEKDIFSPPPTHNAREILRSFSATKRYSKKFLASLAKGLRRSSYFRE